MPDPDLDHLDLAAIGNFARLRSAGANLQPGPISS